MRSIVIWQLDEFRQWVLFKYQRELVTVWGPIRHCGCDIQEDLETDLTLRISKPGVY